MVWVIRYGKPGKQRHCPKLRSQMLGPLVQPWTGHAIPCLKHSPHPHIPISYGSLLHFIQLSAQLSPHQTLSLTSLLKIR